MKKMWLYAFTAVSLANLAAVALQNQSIIVATKPLLMPLLGGWLASQTYHDPPRFSKRTVFAGLAFATLGDIFLLFGEQPVFFILGLLSFLFTHLSYIGAFSAITRDQKGYLRYHPGWFVPFLAYPVVLLWILWPGIDMKLAVSIYAVVITAMGLSVLNLYGHVKNDIFRPLMAGALFFMLSDSLLAMRKFGTAGDWAPLAVMATYIAGQFFIVKGVRDAVVVKHG